MSPRLGKSVLGSVTTCHRACDPTVYSGGNEDC